jgi:hypothetical protein
MCGIAGYVDFATGDTSLPVLEAKRTLYRGIQQVEPECFLEFDHRGIREGSPFIIRASFSEERMTYLPEESKVIYESKACARHRSGSDKEEKVFDALECWRP